MLAAALAAQVLLLAFQVKREHDVRLLRYWAVEIVTPGERAATWTFSKAGAIWYGYLALHSARAENERLRQEVGALRLRNRELESQATEAQRLSALLNFRDAHAEAPMLAAQVIGASADPASHTLFINRGERDRVRRNQPVITPDGIVGKIVEVFPATAQVLLISDKDSGVGALLADTRTHGVVKGTGAPDPALDYVVNDEKVHPGEVILTSGEDRIFPKGLLVGTVADEKPGNPFQVIHVSTAARLDRLEDVLVLLTRQELVRKETENHAAAAPEGNAGTAGPEATGVVQGLLEAPANAPPASRKAGAQPAAPGSRAAIAPSPAASAPGSAASRASPPQR